MAVLVPQEGYCQAADVSILTGRVYSLSTAPTETEVETSVKNATGLINSRLLALGVPLAGVGENAALLSYLLPVAARWAAGEVSFSLGDTERGRDFEQQALSLLDRLDAAVQQPGLGFGTTTEDEPQRQGEVYGAFSGTDFPRAAAGSTGGVGQVPDAERSFFEPLAADTEVPLGANNQVLLRIDHDATVLGEGQLLEVTIAYAIKAIGPQSNNQVFGMRLVLQQGQDETVLWSFDNRYALVAGPQLETASYFVPQAERDWHLALEVSTPQARTSDGPITFAGLAANQPQTYLRLDLVG